MKNKSFSPALVALVCMVFVFENCEDKCVNDVSIDAVQPYSSPAGYEVLLKTSGFSDTVKVVFGLVEAISKPGGQAGEIIATVPDGLLGNVEISVEEGDCIGRSAEFVVSGSLPANVQPSLHEIIVPIPAASIPTDGIENDWTNADTKSVRQGIHLKGDIVAGVYDLAGSYEFYDGDDPFFKDNPVTGTANTNTNVIYLEIDRSAKVGGFIEHFDGSFIENPDFLPVNPNSNKPAILLVSRETGRQLLLYYP
ncbi:MAG: hypothetical protein H7246_12510 [Phycisphaerae bacterium]|nr:hypothetical protein [Saprospiraceae bacterium]